MQFDFSVFGFVGFGGVQIGAKKRQRFIYRFYSTFEKLQLRSTFVIILLLFL